ncbi:MAG: hypothetical protein U9P90_01600 [Patescibacteria group bacterium]|nr:hypothetical protein [Patescibacteria group bacterium]
MKRLWILVVFIFSAVILFGMRSHYTTSRITVLRQVGSNMRQNRVTILYEESKNGHSFYKRAEYHVYLKKSSFYGEHEGTLKMFSKDGASRLGLDMDISHDGVKVKGLYSFDTDFRFAEPFYYNDNGCRNMYQEQCSEEEKAMYVRWSEKLWSSWRKQMDVTDRVYKIQTSPPPLTPAPKLVFSDFMPRAKRKSAPNKIVFKRSGAGTIYDQVLIQYLENVDGFYYQRTATYLLYLKTNAGFEVFQGHFRLFSKDGARRFSFWVRRDGSISDVRFFDLDDGFGDMLSRSKNYDIQYAEKVNKLWKVWGKRLSLAKRVTELIKLPPSAEPVKSFNFEDFMP